ncbi:MAG: hypothetical protein Q4G51_05340 [Dermatophilus congolensis]|nr:hypothetical protein [Dermatophilus congolensis]
MKLTESRASRTSAQGRRLGAEWAPRACTPSVPGGAAVRAESMLTGVADQYGVPGAPVLVMGAERVREFAAEALAPQAITASVRMESRTEQGRVLGLVLVAGTRAVVAVERSLSDPDDLSVELTGEVAVAKLPTAALPMLWLRWAGPLHTAEGKAGVVEDAAALDRRVGDASEPVPAEAPGLASMWAGPWREWSLRDESRDAWLRYVSVPGHGVYVERPVKGAGAVEFAPRPGGLVWGDIVRAYCALEPVRATSGNEAHW